MQDYYEMLGVSTSATTEEIRRAYRRRARDLHPDHAGPESEEAFKNLSVAYDVLSNPEKRRRYDLGGPGAFNGGGSSYAGDFGFADLFQSMFGAMGGFGTPTGPTQRSRRGQDSLLALELSLDEIVFGAKKEVKVNTAVTCESCEGSCCAPGTSPLTCTTCGGTGSISRIQQSLLGAIRTQVACHACQGHGQTIPHPCEECSGQGRVRATRTVTFEVPPGVDNGARIRLSGKGEAGPAGGPAGDLYVEIREKPHPLFSRQGNHLHTRIAVPMALAALGTVFSLETLDGDQEVVIPAGTQPESEIVLKGLGVGRVGGGPRGNLYVHVGVSVPTDLDSSQREVLEEFARSRNEHRVDPHAAASGGGPLKWFKDKMGSW